MTFFPQVEVLSPVRGQSALAGRSLVPYVAKQPPVPVPAARATGTADTPSTLQGKIAGIDARAVSPRQLADISMDLYVHGALDWKEYAMLAFQPELHPDYGRTIGALTGEPAEPDRPRDFVDQWESRLSFEKRYNADRPDLLTHTQRIVDVLKRLKVGTDIAI